MISSKNPLDEDEFFNRYFDFTDTMAEFQLK